MNPQKKRTAIVTGAYGAIGQAIASGIAKKGYSLTLIGRDAHLLEKTREKLIRKTANPDIFYDTVDLSLQSEIMAFSQRWKGPLHLLVNNAATAPQSRIETSEGIEMQWAVNVLAYFRMTKHLLQFLEMESGGRIVNVASYWAGGLQLNDPEFKTRAYDNDVAYRQAKQANRMLTVAFAGRLKSLGITVNSCHPGDVDSKLSNAFGFGGSESPEQGAATPLFLALSEEVAGISGKYYEHLKPVDCQFSKDHPSIEKLFDLCNLK